MSAASLRPFAFVAALAATSSPLTLFAEEPPPVSAASPVPDDSATRAPDPNWFEKLLARETSPLPETRLLGAEDSFQAKVFASILAPPKAAEGFQYFALGIGSSAPAECWVYDSARDPAAALRTISDEMLRLIAERHGPIEAKAVQRIDAGVFGDIPYLALDWIYRVSTKQGAQAGQLKHLAGTKHERTILCVHNEPGYAESFSRVFGGLLASFDSPKTAQKAYYTEVMLIAVGGRRNGFGRLTFSLDRDGDTVVREQTAMLLAGDMQTVRAHDSQRIEFSRPDGSLISEISAEAENGELQEKLRLDHGAEGWHVSGTLRSKDFTSALGEHALLSDLGEMRAFRAFIPSAKPGSVLRFAEWSADVDPGKVTETEFVVAETSADGAAGTLKAGNLAVQASVERTGSFRSARFSLGATTMEIDRVHVEGTVPSQ
jgi:hypothetical protein